MTFAWFQPIWCANDFLFNQIASVWEIAFDATFYSSLVFNRNDLKNGIENPHKWSIFFPFFLFKIRLWILVPRSPIELSEKFNGSNWLIDIFFLNSEYSLLTIILLFFFKIKLTKSICWEKKETNNKSLNQLCAWGTLIPWDSLKNDGTCYWYLNEIYSSEFIACGQ